MKTQKTIWQLFLPIALETLFMMLAGMVDTVMLSSVSDGAVGAIGTANSYINIFIIMFGIISSGMVAVVTQYIGAGRMRVAGQALAIGLGFNGLIGAALSALLCLGSETILRVAGIAPMLMEPARQYLQIVGGGCFLNAFISVLSAYLRSFGHTRQSLIASVMTNVLNLILNAVFLFVCRWGVVGVALATVISKAVNLLAVAIVVKRKISVNDGSQPMPVLQLLKQMIRIGLPAAFETALYNMAAAITVRFLNQMDAQGMNVTARTYAQQLANFCFCGAAALSQANGLMTGWMVGAGQFRDCDAQTRRVGRIAIVLAAGTATVFALLSRPLLGLFTQDAALIALASRLMYLDIALEMGRAGNLVYGQALKVSGDALYPSTIGAVFMYLLMVGGGWFFGICLGMEAVGIYIGLAADECVRAILMYLRWHSGRWQKKGVVRRTL